MRDPEPTLKPHGRASEHEAGLGALLAFFDRHQHVTVLSGAGCSTASGIPDYRDDSGNWKHRQPVQFAEFCSAVAARQRYWAQSFAGFSRISSARPNGAHMALASLEQANRIDCVVTQNVDNLHRIAGSRNVIDLHGVLERVRCLGCSATVMRRDFQARLAQSNPLWQANVHGFAPDGDARLATHDFRAFSVPDCETCGGILKPDVVFFGEAVPAARVGNAGDSVCRSDALLVVGSSLMVFSGFRLARLAKSLGKPIAIINRGTTRADDLADCKVTEDCGTTLSRVVDHCTKGLSHNARGLGGCL